VRDADGVSLGEALRAFGCDTAAIAGVARDPARICGYLESHIEQGPVLEAEKLALGVVTAIAGTTRFSVTVKGEAGHAGTVPMGRRKDALAAAALMITAVETQARATPDMVATVGVISARPGAINVIPAEITFSVDLRAPTDAARHDAVAALEGRLHVIAAERGLGLVLTPLHEAQATRCDLALIEQLRASLTRLGHRPFELPSGAGHDAMAIASLCPVAMLFLRCKGGVSHNPAESITLEDADAAVEVMLDFLLHYLPPRPEEIEARLRRR
jgi:allantoate deiminase